MIRVKTRIDFVLLIYGAMNNIFHNFRLVYQSDSFAAFQHTVAPRYYTPHYKANRLRRDRSCLPIFCRQGGIYVEIMVNNVTVKCNISCPRYT